MKRRVGAELYICNVTAPAGDGSETNLTCSPKLWSDEYQSVFMLHSDAD
jgi:hypothetical protein